MKTIYKLLGIMVLCFMASTAFAQTPQGINYQALVRDANGNIATNAAVTFRFTVLEGTATGTQRFMETKSVSTDQYGMANLVIGSGTASSGSFGAIDWSKSNYLKIEVNLTGSYVSLGTQKFQSVPYALNAGGGAWTVSGSNAYRSSGNVGIGTSSPDVKLDVNGTMNVENGIIQRGGAPINARNDLGLYSRVSGHWMRFVSNDADIRFFTQEGTDGVGDDASAAFTIKPNGFVGVKMPNPTVDFEVRHGSSGAATYGLRIRNEASNDHYWGFYTNNSIDRLDLAYLGQNKGTFDGNSGTYTAVSDRKFKKNIENVDAPVMPGLLRLNLVKYHFNEQENSERKYLGMIAQEVRNEFPDIVYENVQDDGSESFLTMDYSAFGLISVKAIQEQQAEIQTLKEEMAALRAELEALKNK